MLSIKQKNLILAAVLTTALVELIRTAWISDDAAITLRTVLNFIHGYGATFNIDERVQAYTHPLWFLLISGLSMLTKNIFASTFILSIGISLAVLWLLITRIASNFWAGIIGACILMLSKAYVDFSTSGLENPLSHLLILLTLFLGLKATERPDFPDIVAFFLLCSLLYLNRPDLVVLAFPLALLVIYKNRQHPKSLVTAIALAALPVLLWTLFSIYYYGFPFPNTAYAKLGTGIPTGELALQGGKYLLDSAFRDPLTLFFILVGIVTGLRHAVFGRTLAAGVILYLVYVVNIGGDFMSGRFLTVPLLIATVIVARSDISKPLLSAIAIGAGILAMIGINATLLSGASYNTYPYISSNNIADERGYYFQRYGLLTAKMNTFSSPDWTIANRAVRVKCGGLGFAGITQGPGTHLIDDCALADPLLARLPAKHDPNWRIGHFVRQLPTDYQESVRENINLLKDPTTKNFYDAIRLITRGQLNDPQRLREIVKINSGLIRKPDWHMYMFAAIPRSSGVPVVDIGQLNKLVPPGTAWNAPGNIEFGSAIEVTLPANIKISTIDLSLDNNDTHKVAFFFNGQYVPILEIPPNLSSLGMIRHVRTLDTPTPPTNRIRITAISGDGMYALGHFRINSQP
ncbi:MAG: hypothetical protein ABL868_01125 [Sulfuriferula sp.]